MNTITMASRTRARLVSQRASLPQAIRQLPRSQRRFASYQRFPDRGGRSGTGSSYKAYSNFAPYARLQYLWRNYRTPISVLGFGGSCFYVFNLEQVPITGRRRFNVISPETERSIMAEGAYRETLQQFRGKILPAEHPYTRLVARIVERLLPSAHGLDGGDWQVHVVDDPNMVNAFVLPGGKVFVFTGLFPVAYDENGLAAVLGHEIAHNVAHHVGERLSRQGITILAAFLLSFVFDVSGQIGNSVSQLVLSLPNGRTQESEADHIGLLMMAESCYDPRRAPELWKRMLENERKHGGAPPQFLSTHPSSSTRGEAMQKWMPEAMQKYEGNQCSITARGFDEFRKLSDIIGKSRMSRPLPVIIGGGRASNDNDWPF